VQVWFDLHPSRFEPGIVGVAELFLDPLHQLRMYNEKHFVALVTAEILEPVNGAQ